MIEFFAFFGKVIYFSRILNVIIWIQVEKRMRKMNNICKTRKVNSVCMKLNACKLIVIFEF